MAQSHLKLVLACLAQYELYIFFFVLLRLQNQVIWGLQKLQSFSHRLRQRVLAVQAFVGYEFGAERVYGIEFEQVA